jgi:hypothetical protein
MTHGSVREDDWLGYFFVCGWQDQEAYVCMSWRDRSIAASQRGPFRRFVVSLSLLMSLFLSSRNLPPF